MISNQDSNLVLQAAREVAALRLENTRLREYRNHTERMLALFEGGPHRPSGMVTGEDTFIHQLETLAKAMVVGDALHTDQPATDSGDRVKP